jgi:hypothetical protein
VGGFGAGFNIVAGSNTSISAQASARTVPLMKATPSASGTARRPQVVLPLRSLSRASTVRPWAR